MGELIWTFSSDRVAGGLHVWERRYFVHKTASILNCIETGKIGSGSTKSNMVTQMNFRSILTFVKIMRGRRSRVLHGAIEWANHFSRNLFTTDFVCDFHLRSEMKLRFGKVFTAWGFIESVEPFIVIGKNKGPDRWRWNNKELLLS